MFSNLLRYILQIIMCIQEFKMPLVHLYKKWNIYNKKKTKIFVAHIKLTALLNINKVQAEEGRL